MHQVQCRLCHQYFDTEDMSIHWVMPSKNWYYHQTCYDEWKRMKTVNLNVTLDDESYYALVKDYLWKDIKLPNIDFAKINSQWKNLLKKGRTGKGIFFAIKYYYDYMHGNRELAQGGIGIVDSIYSDAAAFWCNMNNKQQGILEAVVKQQEERMHQRILVAKKEEMKNIKPKYSLDEI